MTETKTKRIKLTGGLKNTSSSVEIKKNGSLVIELYDFSKSAEDHFGNDVAFLLVLSASDKQLMLSKLSKNQEVTDIDPDTLLLQLIKLQFSDYYAIKAWLKESQIAYKKEFDSWA